MQAVGDRVFGFRYTGNIARCIGFDFHFSDNRTFFSGIRDSLVAAFHFGYGRQLSSRFRCAASTEFIHAPAIEQDGQPSLFFPDFQLAFRCAARIIGGHASLFCFQFPHLYLRIDMVVDEGMIACDGVQVIFHPADIPCRIRQLNGNAANS